MKMKAKGMAMKEKMMAKKTKRAEYKNKYAKKYKKALTKISDTKRGNLLMKIDKVLENIESDDNISEEKKDKYTDMLLGLKDLLEEIKKEVE